MFRKVFKCLWSEPVGSTKKHPSDEPSQPSMEEVEVEDAKYEGEKAYNSVRRFVIVKERKGHCLCV